MRLIAYIRWSSSEQDLGDSLRRQTQGAEAYAKQVGGTVDTISYNELSGISSFRGRNRKKGALRRLMLDLEDGSIDPANTTLIMENPDRFSRETVPIAFANINLLLAKGMTIVFTNPYSKYTIADMSSIPVLTLFMQLFVANQESTKKSERVAAAWSAKRDKAAEDKTPVGKKRPFWIDYHKDDKTKAVTFSLNDKATIIQHLFKLASEGVSIRSIAKTLNETYPGSSPGGKEGKGWTLASARRILHSPTAYGAYEPHTLLNGKKHPTGTIIEDYYPAAVKKNLWEKVQMVRRTQDPARWEASRNVKTNPSPRSGTDEYINLFTGLVVDYFTGAVLATRRVNGKPRRLRDNQCAIVPGRNRTSVDMQDFEDTILAAIHEAKDDLFGSQETDLAAYKALLLTMETAQAELNRIDTDLDIDYSTDLFALRKKKAQALNLLKAQALLHENRASSKDEAAFVSLKAYLDRKEGSGLSRAREKLRYIIQKHVKRITIKMETHHCRVWWAADIQMHNGRSKFVIKIPTQPHILLEQEDLDLLGPSSPGMAAYGTVFKGLAETTALGTAPLPSPTTDRVSALALGYIAERRRTSSKETAASLPYRIRRFVDFVGPNATSDDLNHIAWKAYTDSLKKNPDTTPIMRYSYASAARLFLLWLVDHKLIKQWDALSQKLSLTVPRP